MTIAIDLSQLKTAEQKAEEKTTSAWASVRSERDKLLSACDWTQMADNPLSEEAQASWATYRQELRDITDQEDPEAITWPVAPA